MGRGAGGAAFHLPSLFGIDKFFARLRAVAGVRRLHRGDQVAAISIRTRCQPHDR